MKKFDNFVKNLSYAVETLASVAKSILSGIATAAVILFDLGVGVSDYGGSSDNKKILGNWTREGHGSGGEEPTEQSNQQFRRK